MKHFSILLLLVLFIQSCTSDSINNDNSTHSETLHNEVETLNNEDVIGILMSNRKSRASLGEMHNELLSIIFKEDLEVEDNLYGKTFNAFRNSSITEGINDEQLFDLFDRSIHFGQNFIDQNAEIPSQTPIDDFIMPVLTKVKVLCKKKLHVEKFKTSVLFLLDELESSNYSEEELFIIENVLDVAVHSYEFWAPTKIGGLENYKKIGSKYSLQKTKTQKGSGECTCGAATWPGGGVRCHCNPPGDNNDGGGSSNNGSGGDGGGDSDSDSDNWWEDDGEEDDDDGLWEAIVFGDTAASATYFTGLGGLIALGTVPGVNSAILGGWAASAAGGSLFGAVNHYRVKQQSRNP